MARLVAYTALVLAALFGVIAALALYLALLDNGGYHVDKWCMVSHGRIDYDSCYVGGGRYGL